MKKNCIILILILAFVFSFTACTQTLDTQQTNEVLTKALSTLDFENMDQIDLTAQGNISITETCGETSVSNDMNVKLICQMLSQNNKITSQNIQIELKTTPSDEDNQEDTNTALNIETYYKDGTLYGYSNMFGDSYQYQENYPAPTLDDSIDENLPTEGVDISQINDMVNVLTDGTISIPNAIKKGDTVTITWNLTIDDFKNIMLQSLKATQEALQESFPDYEPSSDDELMLDVEASLEGVKIDKFEFTMTIVDERLSNITFDIDVTESTTTNQITSSTNTKANMYVSLKTQNVKISFDEDRLGEIKTNYQTSQSAQQ